MSINVTVACDSPTCLHTVDLYALRNATDDNITGIGWIAQLTTVRASIGGTVEVTRHYCSDDCATAGNAAQRARDARELVRR